VAALIDTNILVYRADPRFPEKQRIARDLLRKGIAADSVRVPHQAVIEFFAVVTRVTRGAQVLPVEEARRETERLLHDFVILYPTDGVVLSAIRGHATYQLSWYDAHLWAYADFFGLDAIVSEDFEHGRLYGRVRAVNPFL
jgi:predicted nucleic acid-binding protein